MNKNSFYTDFIYFQTGQVVNFHFEGSDFIPESSNNSGSQ